jgi:hypothetical protein
LRDRATQNSYDGKGHQETVGDSSIWIEIIKRVFFLFIIEFRQYFPHRNEEAIADVGYSYH